MTFDQPGEPVEPKREKSGLRRSGLKIVGYLLATLLVFGSGVLVGQGGLTKNSLNGKLPGALDYGSVNQVYNLLRKDFDGQLDTGKLTNGLKAGLVSATGDPYTQYFDPAAAKQFNDELNGSFTGIGAELGSDDSGNIIIISPLSGYPAEKAGLQPKDIIVKIDGTLTAGLRIDEAIHKIRGPAGSKVTLTILRGRQQLEVNLVRTQINVASVTYQVDGFVGYLKISQFSNDTLSLTQKAVAEFKSKNVKGIVLDLRGDPGGYLDAAVKVSSLWLKQGQKVVEERRGQTVLSTEYANGDNQLAGTPTVILINAGSASASEIMAGALRDYKLATLVGDKSFGKGSVQQVENLADGSELKVTIARWYTPNGQNIDKQGITPDALIALSDDDLKASKDPQKDKAYDILRSKL